MLVLLLVAVYSYNSVLLSRDIYSMGLCSSSPAIVPDMRNLSREQQIRAIFHHLVSYHLRAAPCHALSGILEAASSTSCSLAFGRSRHLYTPRPPTPNTPVSTRSLSHAHSTSHTHSLTLRPFIHPTHYTRYTPVLQQDLDGNGVVTFNEMMMTALKLGMFVL